MKSISRILPILAIFVFLSCKTQTTEPGTADIIGQASIALDYADYTPPYNGIQVSLIGTNTSTITDDSGNFELRNIPSGTYNVRFSKVGYGDVIWFGKTVQGGGNAPESWKNQNDDPYARYPTLYKQPDLVLTLGSANFADTSAIGIQSGTYLLMNGQYSGSTPISSGGIATYISHTSDVSSLAGHYSAFFYHYYPGEERLYSTNPQSFVEMIDLQSIMGEGFNSGDSIYVAAYGAPIYGASMISNVNDESLNGYYDPTVDKYVLTSLNQTQSPVIGLKIP